MAITKETFRTLIREGQEEIRDVELYDRPFDFEEQGRYVSYINVRDELWENVVENSHTNILMELLEFFDLTHSYFTSLRRRLMKECVISHTSNYDHISIRDAAWSHSLRFEWYPLGVDGLYNRKDYSFCFHVEGTKEMCDIFNQNEQMEELLRQQGFVKDNTSATEQENIRFSKKVPAPKPILQMNSAELELYLDIVYSSVTKELIEIINDNLTK